MSSILKIQYYGFTLVELLVTVAIVGVLAAMAVANFDEYRRRVYESHAQSALNDLVVAEEAYQIDNEAYINCASKSDCIALLPGMPSEYPSHIGLNNNGSTTAIFASSCTLKGRAYLGNLYLYRHTSSYGVMVDLGGATAADCSTWGAS